jgi:IS30 family transposase
MTKHEALKMNAVVAPLIRQGQSPYQVLTNHPELDISVKTLYNYIDQGVLLSRNIDLKRKAGFKPRKHTRKGIRDREVFIGRTYQDFRNLAHADFMEMDTVLSARGCSKCILTLYNPETELLIARLLPRCTERSVKAVFDRLEHSLGTYDFLSVFEVCLTDRGSEFGDPVLLETGISGVQRCSIYYCDPMRSGQKGGIEQVHTMLRMIIPKGTVFTDLTQWDVRKAVDHINATPRANLNGQTPYKLAVDKYGAQIVRFMLQLRYVAPDDVTLTPELLQK